MYLNRVEMIGNLTRDVDVREIVGKEKAVKVATFTLAVNRSYKNAQGEQKEETQFIPCEGWDTGAGMMEKLLKKGDQVFVIGSWKVDEWKDKETDDLRRRDKIRVDSFQKLRSSGQRDSDVPVAVSTEANGDGNEAAGNGNDIPF